MKTSIALLTAALTAATFSAIAAPELSRSEISLKFQQAIGGNSTSLRVKDVETAPMEGYYQVITEQGLFYVSKDGRYLISGALHELKPGLPNLTDQRMAIERAKMIDGLKHDFITYRAPNEKHEVIVFYDTTCGFCHRMHNDIAQYNAQGITIHYAAFPRDGIYDRRQQGVKAQGYQLLQDIWCADNQNLAFNLSARQAQVERRTCDTTIEQQYQLGVALGVRGTPAIYSMEGTEIVPGYVPASQLLQRLEGTS